MKKINIAIDGPSGSGKSSTAKAIAQILNYKYIDSGAMYRAVTWYFLSQEVNWKSKDEVKENLENIEIEFDLNPKGESITLLNGKVVEREIRSMPVSDNVSEVSSLADVREAMVELQRKMGEKKEVVMDGRDIGTNVFPGAELKIYMLADPGIRAKRRKAQLMDQGINASEEEILANLVARDEEDSSRELNPLKKAEDAIELDSSNLSFEDQVNFIVEKAKLLIED